MYPTEFLFFFLLTTALYFLFKSLRVVIPFKFPSHCSLLVMSSYFRESRWVAMTNKARHKRESLCEKSMDLIMNIIKLSSLSLARKSFRTARLPAKRNRVPVTGAVTVSIPHQLPASQALQEPENGSKSYSYLIEIERKSPSYMIPEIENVDDRASDYIRGFHAKNRHDSSTASKQLSYILSPPPPFSK